MRFGLAVAILVASFSCGAAFAPVARGFVRPSMCSFSTVEADTQENTVEMATDVNAVEETPATSSSTVSSGAEIKARLEQQLEKLREKDSKSPQLSKEVSDGSHECSHYDAQRNKMVVRVRFEAV